MSRRYGSCRPEITKLSRRRCFFTAGFKVLCIHPSQALTAVPIIIRKKPVPTVTGGRRFPTMMWSLWDGTTHTPGRIFRRSRRGTELSCASAAGGRLLGTGDIFMCPIMTPTSAATAWCTRGLSLRIIMTRFIRAICAAGSGRWDTARTRPMEPMSM